MPKIAKVLGALEVKRLSEPKLHMVGTVPGLGLSITKVGARSWILRTTVGARRSDIGLGAYPAVTLAEAWTRARDTLTKIRNGVDPVAERRARQELSPWTFKRCAETYIAGHRDGWKNDKHAQQWENTLDTYVYPIFGDKHVRDVGKPDVLAAIEPNWTTKNETMVRVRNRIEMVLSWAAQRGYRPEGLNPARWRGNLDAALPRPSKVNNRESFKAVPIGEAYAFMQRLKLVEGMSARALEFLLLTASRSGAVRLATWSEIEGDVWNIPAEHMKASRAHRVPLSPAAVALLDTVPRVDGIDYIFPGRGDKPLSDMSLSQCMRRMKIEGVPHGLRSTFKDWSSEKTNHPNEVSEMALAHAVGSDTEAAYRRGDLFDKRRHLMDDWALFLTTAPKSGNVTQIRGVA